MSISGNPESRNAILKKIKSGVERATLPIPFPEIEGLEAKSVYAASELMPEERFAHEFIKLGGKFVFCDTINDLLNGVQELHDANGWLQLLCSEPALIQIFHNNKLDFVQQASPKAEKAEACITGCELLVARTGSIMLSSAQPLGRVSSIFFPVHIVVAKASQVVNDIPDALAAMQKRYGANLPSMINLNTGPSRTADIEKTLVVGVHGPREVYCFMLNG